MIYIVLGSLIALPAENRDFAMLKVVATKVVERKTGEATEDQRNSKDQVVTRDQMIRKGFLRIQGKYFDYLVSPDSAGPVVSGGLRNLVDGLAKFGSAGIVIGDDKDKGFQLINGVMHDMGVEKAFQGVSPEKLVGATIRVVPEIEYEVSDGARQGKKSFNPEGYVYRGPLRPTKSNEVFNKDSARIFTEGDLVFTPLNSPRMSRWEQLNELSTKLKELERGEISALKDSVKRLSENMKASNPVLKAFMEGVKGPLKDHPQAFQDFVKNNSKSQAFPGGIGPEGQFTNGRVGWTMMIHTSSGSFGLGLGQYIPSQGIDSGLSKPPSRR